MFQLTTRGGSCQRIFFARISNLHKLQEHESVSRMIDTVSDKKGRLGGLNYGCLGKRVQVRKLQFVAAYNGAGFGRIFFAHASSTVSYWKFICAVGARHPNGISRTRRPNTVHGTLIIAARVSLRVSHAYECGSRYIYIYIYITRK